MIAFAGRLALVVFLAAAGLSILEHLDPPQPVILIGERGDWTSQH